MKPSCQIAHLISYGPKGWIWMATTRDASGETRTAEYRTTSQGEGLFVRVVNGPSVDWKQLKGLCDFRLNLSRRSALASIRREMLARA